MNRAEKQRMVSLAAMTGRLEGSADSLEAVLAGYGEDLGIARVCIERAQKNLRDAAENLRAIYRNEAGILEHGQFPYK